VTETIRAVATQGRQDAAEWVKTYRLAYSRDGKSYYSYISRTNVSTHAERERGWSVEYPLLNGNPGAEPWQVFFSIK